MTGQRTGVRGSADFAVTPVPRDLPTVERHLDGSARVFDAATGAYLDMPADGKETATCQPRSAPALVPYRRPDLAASTSFVLVLALRAR